jgi:hypothetical protein
VYSGRPWGIKGPLKPAPFSPPTPHPARSHIRILTVPGRKKHFACQFGALKSEVNTKKYLRILTVFSDL